MSHSTYSTKSSNTKKRRFLVFFYYGKEEKTLPESKEDDYVQGEQIEPDNTGIIQRGGVLLFCATSLWASLIIYGLCQGNVFYYLLISILIILVRLP